MSIVDLIRGCVSRSLEEIFEKPFAENDFQINQVRPEFEGDYSIVLFALVKKTGLSPAELAQKLEQRLRVNEAELFSGFQLVKGFLNITISEKFWLKALQNSAAENFGYQPPSGRKIMVEYSSPNTNKPLHLGHLRNNFLGYSVAEILKGCGHEVIKTCIVNDRGIHICKSMVAWKHYGNAQTPQSSGTKGDHFVGQYYVKFNEVHKQQTEELVAQGMKREEAENAAPIMQETRKMLQLWEEGDEEVMQLWRMMNGWVYEGFNITYKNIGSDFHRTYYESETYLLGKRIVEMGLEKGVFYRKDDGSVWIDLTADGLDEKLVLRSDGTSVYITQDIGLALQKYEQYGIDENIYVIGDEQNYHMKVLKLICQKLNLPNADNIQHLSYGMVELPTGKMKSREGTVVDADDMVTEMRATAEQHTRELGKTEGISEAELSQLFDTIGMGAMKFYLLRVDPKKKMVFNPEESIDFHGFTGPFIQYTHARIKSILQKAGNIPAYSPEGKTLLPGEKEVVVMLEQFPAVVKQSAAELNPSHLAGYLYNLAKQFNHFYTIHSVLKAESDSSRELRLQIAVSTASVIRKGMNMLGIQVPDRM